MKVSKPILAGIAAALMLATGAANAATYQLATTPTGPTLLSGDLGLVGNQVAVGAFSENWYFNLGSDQSVGGAVANIAFSVTPSINFNISNLGVELFDALNTSIGGGAGITSFTEASLPFGNYRLAVTGLADGSQGGVYSGAVSVAAPVPLPAALPLLLVGLAATAAVSRRRRAGAVAEAA